MEVWTYEQGGRRVAVMDLTWGGAYTVARRILADDDRATGRGLRHCDRAVIAAAAVVDRRRQAAVRGVGMDPYLTDGTMTGTVTGTMTGGAAIPRGSMLDGSSDECIAETLDGMLGSLPDCSESAVEAAERECGGWR